MADISTTPGDNSVQMENGWFALRQHTVGFRVVINTLIILKSLFLVRGRV